MGAEQGGTGRERTCIGRFGCPGRLDGIVVPWGCRTKYHKRYLYYLTVPEVTSLNQGMAMGVLPAPSSFWGPQMLLACGSTAPTSGISLSLHHLKISRIQTPPFLFLFFSDFPFLPCKNTDLLA